MYVVRGYHAYKDIWDPVLEDQFGTKHHKHNSHDNSTYAVAVVLLYTKVEMVVEHLPREIAKECGLFTYHGSSITGIVEGKRHRTKEPCGGIEIQWIPLYWSTSVREYMYFGPIKRRTRLSEVWLIHYPTFVFDKVD